jgi:hypothetical protein
MQDDKGPEIVARIVEFLERKLPPAAGRSPQASDAVREGPAPAGEWTLELDDSPIDESAFRPDPLLQEQELDVRPEVALALERAAGIRAGTRQWRSRHGHRYVLELGDVGRGRPSMATLYGLWDRWEPRPPDSEIDADLLDFCLWSRTWHAWRASRGSRWKIQTSAEIVAERERDDRAAELLRIGCRICSVSTCSRQHSIGATR